MTNTLVKSAYRRVIDPLSDNQCDTCTRTIEANEVYYAQEDDRYIVCRECYEGGLHE